MNNRFFYLYLAGGTITLFFLIYQIVNNRGAVRIALDVIMMIVFYYLAFKVYREKKDHDMM